MNLHSLSKRVNELLVYGRKSSRPLTSITILKYISFFGLKGLRLCVACVGGKRVMVVTCDTNLLACQIIRKVHLGYVPGVTNLELRTWSVYRNVLLSTFMFYQQESPKKDSENDSSSILFSLNYLPATNRLGVFVLKAKDLKTTQDNQGKKIILTLTRCYGQ